MKSMCGVVLLIAIPAALLAGEARSGEAIFSKICRTCHGPQGEGNPAVAKALKADIPDLRSKEVQAKTDEELAKIILEGKGKMKPVRTVSSDEAREVARYVRTLAK